MTDEEIQTEFEQTGALLSGHFELRSGLHSDRYFQCARVLQYPSVTARLCGELARRLTSDGVRVDTVISPAMGGLFVGHELARSMDRRSIFAEKEQDRLVLRRGFEIGQDERFLVAEDVITRGGRVQETVDIVTGGGGRVAAVAVLVDRSGGAATFDAPLYSLLRMTPVTWEPAGCPLCAQGMPLAHPGS